MKKNSVAHSNEERPRTDFVSAVGRAMSILECFTSDDAVKQSGRLTLTEAAKLTTLSRGTARRLLLTLRDLHYVDTDGKYFWLTPKLINLSRGLHMPKELGQSSASILKSLTEVLNESASVGILEANEIIYIERREVRRILSSQIVNGTRLPAANTSIGRVLLADLSDKDLHKWLQSYPLIQKTKKTITDEKQFWNEISKIRKNGYAINDEELEIGIRSIAVPIKSPSGRTIAALNSSTISAQNSVSALKKNFLPHLLKASSDLSKTIGW